MERIVIKCLGNSRLHKDVAPDAINEIGSFFDSTTRDVLRGLSTEDELKYLPGVLGISANHPDFNEKARKYWMNISIIVPVGEGCPLNVAMIENKDKKLVPQVPQDYIKYQYIKKLLAAGKCVAESEELARGNDKIYSYYIIDEGANRKIEQNKLQARKVSQKLYLELTYENLPEQLLKGKWILEMMKEYLVVLKAKDVQNLDTQDVHLLLEEAATKFPNEFSTIASDPKLELRGFITLAISKAILTKNGNAVYYIDNLLGKDMEQAVNYLSADANSDLYGKLKYQVEAALRVKK